MADFSTLRIEQGATLEFVLQCAQPELAYAAIQGITKSGPAVITAANHGVPDGWPVAIVSAGGMTQINAANWPLKDKDFTVATAVDANTLSLNGVNSTGYGTHTANTGYVVYRTPMDLAGAAARAQLRDKIGGALLFADLTDGAGLTIDETAHAVAVTITDAVTAAITTKKAALSVELATASGKVIRLMQQTGIPVDREVTV